MVIDWSNLPYDPVTFFSLASDFTIRDLKRAYGRMIKAYRPETHPKEFQIIRAAYEQLLAAFQASGTPGSLGLPDLRDKNRYWEELPSAFQDRESRPGEDILPQQANPPPWLAPDVIKVLLEEESASLREYRQRLKTLARTLARFPEDPEYQAVLRDLCDQHLAISDLEWLLLEICLTVPAERMLAISGPLFEHLLLRDFPAFCAIWDQFVEGCKRDYPQLVLRLLVRLLPMAVWLHNYYWVTIQVDFTLAYHDRDDGENTLALGLSYAIYHCLSASHLLKDEIPPLLSECMNSMESFCLARNAEKRGDYFELHQALLKKSVLAGVPLADMAVSQFEYRFIQAWDTVRCFVALEHGDFTQISGSHIVELVHSENSKTVLKVISCMVFLFAVFSLGYWVAYIGLM
ncbi:MAG: hypothetical protein R3C12_07990 [Planctomycetaceae bacterium]